MPERILATLDHARLAPTEAVSGLLRLYGQEHRSGDVAVRTEVFFAGAAHTAGADLGAVQVVECTDDHGVQHWQLRTPTDRTIIHATSVQVHRDAAGPFYRALPQQGPAWHVRLGWAVLLALLRIPGAATLIAKLRSR